MKYEKFNIWCKLGFHNWLPYKTMHNYVYGGDGSGKFNNYSEVQVYKCLSCEKTKKIW